MGDQDFALNPGTAVVITDLGLSPAAVLRRAGLPAGLFAGGGQRVTPEEYVRLWEALETEADDPDLPIRIGTAISVEAFDPPIFAALCSPHLDLAARRIAQYKPLIGPLRIGVSTVERATEVEIRWPAALVPPTGLATTELVFWVALARLATRTHVVPVEVTSRDPQLATAALAEYLGVWVRWGPQDRVTFSARDASRAFLTSHAAMWDVFEPDLRRRLSQLQARTSTTDRVRAALHELLPAGRSAIDDVAREMAVGARTVQRHLAAEGTTFQAELGTTREALARHYLARDDLSVAHIAYLLGYAETSSFYRAFQAWTGQTPGELKARAEATAGL